MIADFEVPLEFNGKWSERQDSFYQGRFGKNGGTVAIEVGKGGKKANSQQAACLSLTKETRRPHGRLVIALPKWTSRRLL